MTKLILIRHGQTVWNKLGKYQGQADIELSQEGLEQAEKLKEHFSFENVKGIYASSLKRAMDTGKAVAEKFDLPVVPCDELREISF